MLSFYTEHFLYNMSMKKILYLAGLPRSGSTLLCNILNCNKKIHATPSSPLCHMVQGIRKQWSNDTFLLSQLDNNFENINKKLRSATNGLIYSWHRDIQEDIVIDKNRGWLFSLELLKHLDPEFKIILTLRDLRKIYASIEKRHRKTILLEFPDNLEVNLVDVRANQLFAEGGLIGSILKGLYNIGDIPDISKHIYIWRYEDFIKSPEKTTESLFSFIGVENCEIDFNNIPQTTHESDSHYRMKYPHIISKSIKEPEDYSISPRIANEIIKRNIDFYRAYYPDILEGIEKNNQTPPINQINQTSQTSQTNQVEIREISDGIDSSMISKLEEAIKKETRNSTKA